MTDAAIDQILAALVVNLKEFAVCEFASDCAIRVRPLEEIEIHFVLSGTLYLTLDCGEALAVPPGGVVLVPPNVQQVMGGSPNPSRIFQPAETCTTRPDRLLFYDVKLGGPGAVLIVCGIIRADLGGSFGPFDGLATPICCDLSDHPMVRMAFETMLQETGTLSLGSRALVASLMKACLVVALRTHSERHGTEKMLPGLFAKPSLARALAAVVEDPSADHTLNELARAAGMSRSKFARVFMETTGSSPMEFVARTRLERARHLIVSTDLPVSSIANQVGFASRSHFSRAFRNAFGVDPRGMRRDIGADVRETGDA